MSNQYKPIFSFLLLLVLGTSIAQNNSDTIKVEMKSKDVLIINKDTFDEWDFDAEQENNKEKKLNLELFFGTTGYGEYIDNSFYIIGELENSSTNYLKSHHWGANLMVKAIESKNRRFYLNTGLGFSLTTFSFSNSIQLMANSDNTTFSVDSTNLKFSKFKLNYIQVPLLIGLRIGNLAKNPIGVQLGSEIAFRTTAKTITRTSQNTTTQQKKENKFNTTLIQLSPMARISIGNIGFFGKLSLRPLFTNNQVDYYPFSCGIVFANF